MTPSDKLTALSILSRKLFYTKQEHELHNAIISSLMNDLIPRELLPYVLSEVYIGAPHVITNHETLQEAMDKLEKVRDKENLYALHVKKGDEVEYTWSRQ